MTDHSGIYDVLIIGRAELGRTLALVHSLRHFLIKFIVKIDRRAATKNEYLSIIQIIGKIRRAYDDPAIFG